MNNFDKTKQVSQKNSRSGINWSAAQAMRERERAAFVANNPQSKILADRAAQHMLFGVPLHWMNDWSTPFALSVSEAKGAQVIDVDHHQR